MDERNTNRNNIILKDLLEYLGETVVNHGRNYHKLEKHDSLILKDSKFYWNSRHIGGNFHDLLKSLYGYSKKQIWDITEKFLDDVYENKYIPTETIKTYENKKNVERPLNINEKNKSKIFEYLCDVRKMNENTVKYLYNNELVKIDNKNNILFNIKDKDENHIDYEIIGTVENKKYKRNLTHYGFNIVKAKNISDIDTLYVFESSIDLISYLELSKNNKIEFGNNIRFLSISGLREDILKNYIDNIHKIHICTDNDLAGENFFNHIKEKYKDLEFFREKSINKDWNDDLKESKVINNWNKRDNNKDFER